MKAQAEIVGLLIIVVLLISGFSIYLLFAFNTDRNTELLSDQQTYLTMFSPTLAEHTVCATPRGNPITTQQLAFADISNLNDICSQGSNQEILNNTLEDIFENSLSRSFPEGTFEFVILVEGVGSRTYYECDEGFLQKTPRSHSFRTRVGGTSGQITFRLEFCQF